MTYMNDLERVFDVIHKWFLQKHSSFPLKMLVDIQKY